MFVMSKGVKSKHNARKREPLGEISVEGNMKKTFFCVVIVSLASFVLLSSCTTIRDPYLISVKTDSNEVYNDRGGYTVQTIEEEGLVVSMEGLDLGVKDKGVVLVELENKEDTSFNFVDTNMEIFGGNLDTGEWTSLGLWNAEEYYNDAKTKYDTARALRLFSLFVNVAASSTGNNSPGSAGSAIALGSDVAAFGSTYASEVATNGANPEWLRENLLFSSQVRPNNDYSGVVFFDGKEYPDYKIAYTKENGTNEFLFQRSDREEILNPWLDRSRLRMSLGLNFKVTNGSKGVGFSFIIMHPTSLGAYMGGYFGKAKIEDIEGNISDHELISLPAGFTMKVLPHVWIMAGIDFSISNYASFGPQLGLNFAANMLDFYVLGSYNTKTKKVGIDLGFGFVF